MVFTHKIISIEAAKTKRTAEKFPGDKGHNDMFRCFTEDGEQVYIFKHNDPERDTFHLFEQAGYADELLPLIEKQQITWRNHPIDVRLHFDGKYWSVRHVAERPANAEPDPVYKPDPAVYRPKAQVWANAILASHLPIVFWDTETTGVGADDEIISIAAVDSFGQVILDTLIRPSNLERLQTRVGQEATKVNGITPEQLLEAPTFPEVYNDIFMALCGKIWVIYNAPFDTRMIDQDCIRHGLPLIPQLSTVCAMEMFSHYLCEWNPIYHKLEPKKLTFACELFDIETEEAHDALGDVLMTRAMCASMVKSMPVKA